MPLYSIVFFCLDLLAYVILVLVAVTASSLGIFIVNQFKEQQKPAPIIINPIEKPTQYPDFDVIKGSSKSAEITQLNITKDCPKNGCVNNKPASIDFDGINKVYVATGKFSRAYLYIEALVDYKRPLTSWDDIFFTIDGLGGHLVTDANNLPIPSDDTSKILYNLRSISFYYDLDDKLNQRNLQSNINLFSLLQDGYTLNIVATSSSDRPGRVLKEVSIYYECFQGSKCNIEERNY